MHPDNLCGVLQCDCPLCFLGWFIAMQEMEWHLFAAVFFLGAKTPMYGLMCFTHEFIPSYALCNA
jgi:hypothetical protein